MCEFCTDTDRHHHSLNSISSRFSNIELAMTGFGVLRARHLRENGGFYSQDMVMINFCPICGRNFNE